MTEFIKDCNPIITQLESRKLFWQIIFGINKCYKK